MTTSEKNVNERYKAISSLIRKCMYAENKNEQIIYGRMLLKKLDECKESTLKTADIFDDLISKLASAAQTIQKDNDMFDCLMLAMGDRKDEICYTASLIQKGIENYKSKNKGKG